MKGKTKYKYSVHDHDVITLRGGAAQQTTHPGNLTLYKLCEERYAEWFEALDGSPPPSVGASKSKSDANDGAGSASGSGSGSGSGSSGAKQYRKGICLEIVRTIQKQGGTFRDGSGRTMSNWRAVVKTNDRMRQIAKPKVAPTKTVHGGGDGTNTDINIHMDVVFKPGGANHLYPGNAKWRFLMDGYCTRYFPELFPVQVQEGPASVPPPVPVPVPVPATPESSSKSEGIGENKNNVLVPVPVSAPVPDGKKTKRLSLDQKNIQNEIIDITHERGGIFRGANLKELPRKATLQKIHGRFKDMKKLIKAGTWHMDDSNCVNESKYILKNSGCTSTKLTVADIESARNRKVNVNVNVNVDEDEDELSLSSDDGEESGSGSGSESESELDNSESEDRIPKTNKKEQNEARSARLRRRREQENTAGDDQPRTKRHRHRRRKRKQNQKRGDCHHHGRDHTIAFVPASDAKLKEMSEYERLRYEKMQRNHNRLSELGLLGGISRKL